MLRVVILDGRGKNSRDLSLSLSLKKVPWLRDFRVWQC